MVSASRLASCRMSVQARRALACFAAALTLLVGQVALGQSDPPLRKGPAVKKTKGNYAPVTAPPPRPSSPATATIVAPAPAPVTVSPTVPEPVSGIATTTPPPVTNPTTTSGPSTQDPANDAVAFDVNNTGLARVTLNGAQVATGGWTLWDSKEYFAPDDTAVFVGPVQSASSSITGPNAWRVVHQFKEVQAVYDYTASGRDISVSVLVTNQSPLGKPMKHVAFNGLTVQFPSAPIDKRVDRHHWSYFRTRGWVIGHPSYYNPVGAWMLRAGAVNFSFAPLEMALTSKILVTPYNPDLGMKDWKLVYLIDQAIPAGQSRTFKMTMRFSSSGDYRHLLEPYKDDYQKFFTRTHYIGDARPLGMTACSGDWRIREDNPLGYVNNQTRFDLDESTTKGVRGFLNTYGTYMANAGAQACIFWDMQGYNTRGAMYRPDFDNVPAPVAPQIPKLIAGLKAKGMRVGILARPGEIVVPASATTDTTQRISSTDTQQMNAMWARFQTALDWGVTDFYLDTFGAYPDDVNIMRQLRAKFLATGKNILTYSEFGIDVLLPYSGFYTELLWNEQKQEMYFGPFVGLDDARIFRYLAPNHVAMAQVRVTQVPDAEIYRFCLKEKVLPLLHYMKSKDVQTTMRSVSSEFVDPATNWWRDMPAPNAGQVAEVAPLFD